MSLEIQTREHESVTVLDLDGRITAGAEAGTFREAMARVTESGAKFIILNMERVDYIDSTGLGALVVCATNLRKQGGTIKLLNLNKRNMELLVLTKLATVFDMFTDEQDAVNSFFPGREIKKFDILSFVQQMKAEGD
jgi:anti-sigma B factor antagonist